MDFRSQRAESIVAVKNRNLGNELSMLGSSDIGDLCVVFVCILYLLATQMRYSVLPGRV